MNIKLEAKLREKSENTEALRKNDEIPAVFYGQGKPATSIKINRQEFIKIYREEGESTLIDLTIDGKPNQVLIKDIQINPVTDQLSHVDFIIIEANKPIEVEVSLEFTGISEAVSDNLGTLNTALDHLVIEVLPKDLPSEIEVDITPLKTLEDSIYAKDIKLPSGCTLVTNEESLVVNVTPIREEEEEEEESTEIDFSQIEVEKKGKQEEPTETEEE